MKICYCTRLLPYEDNFYEKYKKYGFVVSSHKYIMNQLEGFDLNDFLNIQAINVPDIGSYPKFPKIFFQETVRKDTGRIHAFDIGFINIPVLKQFFQNRVVTKNVFRWVKENQRDKIVLMSYSINPTFIRPLLKVRKKFPTVKICLVVGDLWGTEGVDQHNKGLKKFLVDKFMGDGTSLARQADMFIFVADAMAKALNVSEKPYLIIEGINNYGISNSCITVEETEEKTVFYAGNLDQQFGVLHLLDAFELIPNKNYRLILAGGGDSDNIIREHVKIDSRIRFLGYVSPETVREIQSKATVLVNPRRNIGTYTKYSFPSKTMECLASGKPYVAYKLSGIPNEYDDFIQYVEGERPEDFAEKIVQICELPLQERLSIGLKGKEFIAANKNPKALGRKTMEFLERNI